MTNHISLKKVFTLPVTHGLVSDTRLLWCEMTSVLHKRRWLLAASTALVLLALGLWLFPRDADLLRGVQMRGELDRAQQTLLKSIAGDIGYWGDFAGYDLALVLTLWIAGRLRRSRYLRRLAVASLLCATFAGVSANVLRFGVGRPRPYEVERSKVRDGIYGPQFRSAYHSFASAHTATAFGCTIPLAVAIPRIGVPLLIVPTAVAWSRMFGGQHNPSDVMVSVWIAVVFGVSLGLAVRRTRHRCDGDVNTDTSGEDGEVVQGDVVEA